MSATSMPGFEGCELLCRLLEVVLRQALPDAIVDVGYGIRKDGRRYFAIVQQSGCDAQRALEIALLGYIHNRYPLARGIDLSITVQS